MSISCDTEMDFKGWAVNAPHVTWLRINTKIVADMPGPFPLLPRLDSVLGVYHLPRSYNHLSCNITPIGNRHAGSESLGQNAPSGRPFFSELRTLMFMVKPLFVMTDPPAPASVAAYEGLTAELNTILSSFGVPTTVFKPHYRNQDVDVTVAHRQPKHLDEGMRRDWLSGIEGREWTFTPEFWERTPGVLETLWKTVQEGSTLGVIVTCVGAGLGVARVLASK